MSFSATAILGQFAAQHGLHGETAAYLINGEVVIESIDVIPGKSQAEALAESGLVTTIDLQDFQLRSSELVLTSGETPQQFIPDRGHVLRVTRGDQVVDFSVNHPNGNEAPYRRADAYGTVLRVHTLQVVPPEPAPAKEAEEEEEGGGG